MKKHTVKKQTTLWLVRHGETDWNLRGIYQGQADIGLNATGAAQAEQAADWIIAHAPQGGFAALCSSPLCRARQTAQVSAERLGMSVVEDARLMEIHQGEWTGKDYRSVVREFGDQRQGDGSAGNKADRFADGKADGFADGKADGFADGKADGFADGKADGIRESEHLRAPGGESVADVAARMAQAADQLVALFPQQVVLVFTHGLAIATLICQANNLPLRDVYAHIPANGEVTILNWVKSGLNASET